MEIRMLGSMEIMLELLEVTAVLEAYMDLGAEASVSKLMEELLVEEVEEAAVVAASEEEMVGVPTEVASKKAPLGMEVSVEHQAITKKVHLAYTLAVNMVETHI